MLAERRWTGEKGITQQTEEEAAKLAKIVINLLMHQNAKPHSDNDEGEFEECMESTDECLIVEETCNSEQTDENLSPKTKDSDSKGKGTVSASHAANATTATGSSSTSGEPPAADTVPGSAEPAVASCGVPTS